MWIHDEITDAGSLCTVFGCALTPTYGRGVTSVSYSTVSGDPYIFPRFGAPPYTRDLRYGLANSLNPEQFVLSFFITGVVSYSGIGSIPYPPSSPLYILRDPPGGGSSASIESTYAVSRVDMSNTEIDESFSLSEQIKLGVEAAVTTCVGAIVEYTCSPILDAKSWDGITIAGIQTANVNDASATTNQDTYDMQVSTSTDPSVIDGQGDLFMVVVANLDFSLAVKLSGATVTGSTQCIINPPVETIAYSWDPSRYLQWMSAWDINNVVVPEAQQQMQQLLISPNWTTDAELQTRYGELQSAIAGWQSMLALNEQLKATALPFTDILNSTNFAFMGGQVPGPSATPLDGLLQGQTAFSFTGDLSSLTASVSIEVDSATTYSVTAGGEVDVSTGFTIDVGSVVKTAFDTTISATLNVQHGTETDTDNAQTNTVSFTLDDPDQGDQFSVIIMKDTVFGSPVYVTTSGRSRCAAEANTIAREAVIMQLTTSSFAGVGPSDTVTTSLTLTNDSPFLETFGYYLNVEAETNSGGLLVSANGVMLSHNALLLQLAPGPTVVTLSMSRGPGSGYLFEDVELVLSGDPSACASPSSWSALLSVQFLQPCPPVEFTGPLAYSSSFIVNAAENVDSGVGATYYPFILTNPEASIASRDWYSAYSAGFLQSIVVQYQLQGDNAAEWSPVVAYDLSNHRDLTSAANYGINPLTQSSGSLYGFYAYIQTLTGSYNFRAVAQCAAPAGSTADPALVDSSIYSYYSTVKTGLIDRTPPAVFDHKPAASLESSGDLTPIYHPGDDISITYTEAILCQYSEPPGGVSVLGWYAASLDGLGPAMAANPSGTQPMIYQCSGNTVEIDFRSPVWDVLQGQYMAVLVGGVEDAAHNGFGQGATEQQLTFQIASFNVNGSLVYVTGLTFTNAPANLVYQMNAAMGVSTANSSSSSSSTGITDVGSSSSNTRPAVASSSSGGSSGGSSIGSGILADSSSSSMGGGMRRLLQVSSTGAVVMSSSGSVGASNFTAADGNATAAVSVGSSDLYNWLLSSVDPAVVSGELMAEIIAATNLEMQQLKAPAISAANPSGLLLEQINITSLGGGVMAVDFSIAPCGQLSAVLACESISPSAASHYFFESLLDDALRPALQNAARFPFFSQLLFPNDARTPTTSGSFGMSSPVLQITVQPTGYAPGQAPQPDPSQPTSSGSLSPGGVAGLVVGLVVGVGLLLALLLLLCVRARRGHKGEAQRGEAEDATETQGDGMTRDGRRLPTLGRQPSLESGRQPRGDAAENDDGAAASGEGRHAPLSLTVPSGRVRSASAPGTAESDRPQFGFNQQMSAYPQHGHRLPIIMKGDSTLALSPVQLVGQDNQQ